LGQPVALAVTVICLPTTCGEAGLALRPALVQALPPVGDGLGVGVGVDAVSMNGALAV
jgi:hypothetical protein